MVHRYFSLLFKLIENCMMPGAMRRICNHLKFLPGARTEVDMKNDNCSGWRRMTILNQITRIRKTTDLSVSQTSLTISWSTFEINPVGFPLAIICRRRRRVPTKIVQRFSGMKQSFYFSLSLPKMNIDQF